MVETCNDSLRVQFNNKGVLEQDVRSVAVPPVFAPFIDQAGMRNYDDGRTQENQNIEAASLESWQTYDVNWDGEDLYVNITVIKLIDFNGDGLLDRIWASEGTDQNIFVQYNHGASGFSAEAIPVGSWVNNETPLEVSTESIDSTDSTDSTDPGYYRSRQRLLDMNGDGLPDIVRLGGASVLNTGALSNAGEFAWRGFPATNVYNDEFPSMPNPSNDSSLEFGLSDVYRDEYSLLGNGEEKSIISKTTVDMNGDGLPDVVSIHDMGVWVALNTGNAFLPEKKWMTLNQEVPVLSMTWNRQEYSYATGKVSGRTVTENFLRDCNGDGALDFVVPFIAETGMVNMVQRQCKLNRTSKVNRLNSIYNTYTGRTIQLGYTDGRQLKPVYPKQENSRQRTVLSKVRVENDQMSDEPVLIWEYFYNDGAEDQTSREFLGWETLKSENFVEGHQSDLNLITELKEFEFSSVEGLDEWGLNEVSDEYLNGTLLKHEIRYGNSSGWTTQSRVEYEYDDVAVLSTTDDVRFVYPKKVMTSRFGDNGLCLHGGNEGNNDYDDCRLKETKTTTITMDTDLGYITSVTVSDTGDPLVNNSDDLIVIDEFEHVGTGNRVQQTVHRTQQAGLQLSRIEYGYDADGNLNLKTEKAGGNDYITTRYDYFPEGLVESTWIDGRLPTQFDYDFNFANTEWATRMTTTLPDGTTTDEYFDSRNLLVQSTTNGGATTYATYDNRGRLTGTGNHIAGEINKHYYYSTQIIGGGYPIFEATAIVDQDGEEIRISKFVDPMGRQLQTHHRALIDGRPQWVVSGAIEFDDFGRVTSMGKNVLVDSNSEDLLYQPVVENIEPVTYEYDERGRLDKIIDSDGLERRSERTILSQWLDPDNDVELHQSLYVEAIIDQSSNQHKVFRDIHGNVLLEYLIDPDENTSVTQKIIHSALEHEIIDPQGKSSRYYLDYLKRPTRVITPDAGETQYFYNDFGKLDQMVRIGKNAAEPSVTTVYGYDAFGRIKYVNNEDNARDVLINYYDVNEGLAINEWNLGKVEQVFVGFDDNNFDDIDAAAASADLITRFTYGIDYVTKSRSGIVSEGAGNLEAQMKYYADAHGRTRGVEYPDGELVNYSYDMSGRLQSVVGDVEYISDIAYNKDNQRQAVLYGNGVVRSYQYKPASGQLDSMRVSNIGIPNSDMLVLDYEYNDRRLLESVENKMPVDKNDQDFELNYTYDSFGRVESAIGAADNGDWNMSNSYQFDLGIRMESSVVAGIPRVTEFLADSSAPHIVHLYDDTGVEFETKTYDYNNFGEMWRVTTSDIAAGGSDVRQFQFNSDGTLAGVTTEENTNVSFKYDMLGNRVRKESVSPDGVVNLTHYLFNLYSMKNDVINNHISDGTHVVASRLNNDYFDNASNSSKPAATDTKISSIRWKKNTTPAWQTSIDSCNW